MQQVKVKIISPETGETFFTRLFNSVACRMSGPDFGNEEYVFTLTRDDVSDQFLRAAISVYFRCINHGHAERNAFA